MSPLETWHESPNYSLINAINTATIGIEKYGDKPDPTGLFRAWAWRAAAQEGMLNWIKETNPDAEVFRSAIETVHEKGKRLGCSSWDLGEATRYNLYAQEENDEHGRLRDALATRLNQSRNHRSFGDSQVFVKADSEHDTYAPVSRCLDLAYSNGCPDPNEVMEKSQKKALWPAASPFENPGKEYWIDTAVSEYARQNLLWSHVMSLVVASGNQTLLHEIMHGREELKDSVGDPKWMPEKVNGKRQVRFLARTEPYFGIVEPIWERFDELCATGDYELAEKTFNQDLETIAALCENSSSIASLVEVFKTFIEK